MVMTKETLRQISKKEKPIILIGGISGSGKTTMGNVLLHSLEIDHSIGTGWIREILTTQLKKEDYPELFTHSYRPITNITPFENFCKGTKFLIPAVKACIKRAPLNFIALNQCFQYFVLVSFKCLTKATCLK